MNLSEPLASVVPGVRGRVLTVLARTDVPLTGRTVASLVRPSASQAGVQLSLNTLVAEGLVLSEPAGRAHLYRLNRDHLAAGLVLKLANLTHTLFDTITGYVSTWDLPAVAVWLFGSTVRGQAGVQSDVDLLVVRPDRVSLDDPQWLEQLHELSRLVHRWTGNACEVIDYSPSELIALTVSGERLAEELRRDTIALVGPHPRTLLAPRTSV